jgi:NTE family protein
MVPLSQMKTALVLSGGGMFGAYQAGVWKALAPRFRPDMIAGASVGALNGYLIAAEASPETVEAQWLDPAAAEMMSYRFPRTPWSGLFDPRPLERHAKHLVAHYRLRLPFGVALLQLPWLKPKLARDGEITWRHLVASCAIPGGFPPVRIGKGLYCDGGLLAATPVWAAVEMGAGRVVAVNANRFIPPPGVGLMMRGLRRLGQRRLRSSGGAEVTMITPDRYLGRLPDGARWRRETIAAWIALGEADGRRALDCLQNNL